MAPSSARSLRQKLGLIPSSGARTFWVHGQQPDRFAAATSLFRELHDRYPRLRFVLTSGRADTLTWLRKNHEDAIVLPPPWPFAGPARRFFRKLNPRVVLLLGAADGFGMSALRKAAERKVPVVVIDGQISGGAGDRAPSPETKTALDLIELLFVRSPSHEERFRAVGVPSERLVVVEGLTPELSGAANHRIVQSLAPMLRRDLKSLRHADRGGAGGWKSRAMRVLQSRGGRKFLERRVELIPDLESLRRILGNPRTILCLGNGPSSEDPRLREIEFDCLFRVNWQWLKRGTLTNADMVFTGDQKTVGTIRSAILGFQTIEAESRLLIGRIFDPRLPRVRYTTLERLPLFLHEREWDAKPTNGAAMLAVATALQPQRLVIAGMDLFAHPAGSYPGDSDTVNEYTPRHERSVELEIIDAALDTYSGETVILSDVLRRHLEQRRSAAAIGAGE